MKYTYLNNFDTLDKVVKQLKQDKFTTCLKTCVQAGQTGRHQTYRTGSASGAVKIHLVSILWEWLFWLFVEKLYGMISPNDVYSL